MKLVRFEEHFFLNFEHWWMRFKSKAVSSVLRCEKWCVIYQDKSRVNRTLDASISEQKSFFFYKWDWLTNCQHAVKHTTSLMVINPRLMSVKHIGYIAVGVHEKNPTVIVHCSRWTKGGLLALSSFSMLLFFFFFPLVIIHKSCGSSLLSQQSCNYTAACLCCLLPSEVS